MGVQKKNCVVLGDTVVYNKIMNLDLLFPFNVSKNPYPLAFLKG